MLVDDELDILTVFKTGLERYGFRVDAFAEPDQAVASFKPSYYDLVVLDIRMPQLSGFQVAKLLWQADPATKVCFLTAFEIYEEEANKVFKDFNTKCFVKKPIGIEALVRHIESHFQIVSQ